MRQRRRVLFEYGASMSDTTNYFTYLVTVAPAQTTTPKYTFAVGAPAARVDWGDGTPVTAVVSGVEMNHAYAGAGTFAVTLIAPNQATYLTQIDINADKVTSVLTPIQKFPKLTAFRAYTNVAWVQNIGDWVLPTGLVYFLVSVSSLFGDISGWILPAGLTYFYIYSSSLSGNTSGLVLPAGLIEYKASATSVNGCPNLDSMVVIQIILANDTALIQASVDLYLARCVANEGDTTWATPTLNLGGTNQAPSAAGLLDKATLVAAGWIVTTN